jgi:hypothetical protein
MDEEMAAAADNAGSSAAQMGLKDLQAQLGKRLSKTPQPPLSDWKDVGRD